MDTTNDDTMAAAAAAATTSATYDMLMYGGDGINAYYEYFLVIYSILFYIYLTTKLTGKNPIIFTLYT